MNKNFDNSSTSSSIRDAAELIVRMIESCGTCSEGEILDKTGQLCTKPEFDIIIAILCEAGILSRQISYRTNAVPTQPAAASAATEVIQ